ncbi:tetratricopeptide repeat protein [Chryseobacterium sp. JK1]|uniref:tetratricopeptide repeat protein n=1 Tax=Chryseobacterium sp. JK1 TaxID=874294 RepID=UPI003D6866C7
MGIVAIAKNKLFTNPNDDLYNKGWTEYQSGEFQKSIMSLSGLDIKEYPKISMALGDSYFEMQDYKNAEKYLQITFDKHLFKNVDEKKMLTNMLGICNIELKNYKNARFFLEESEKLGNPNSKRNLQILDSLENRNNK